MRFDEFWPGYLKLHARPSVRRLHAVATASAIALLAAALLTRSLALALAAPLCDYAIAQASHRWIDGVATRPYRHPWLHLRGELRLFAGTIRGLARRRRRS